ncbi:Uncharacterised protein g836 [Pycnogonum litorale]
MSFTSGLKRRSILDCFNRVKDCVRRLKLRMNSTSNIHRFIRPRRITLWTKIVTLLAFSIVTVWFVNTNHSTDQSSKLNDVAARSIDTTNKKPSSTGKFKNPEMKHKTTIRTIATKKGKSKIKNGLKDRTYSPKAFHEFLNSSRPRLDYHQISFLISPKQICNEKIDFLMVVHSSVNYRARRNVLRYTIGRYNKKSQLKYKMMFVVGTPTDNSNSNMLDVLREHNDLKDILLIDIIDDYRNMTHKALGWLKFVSEKCTRNVKHIIKMDDDALIKMPQLIDMLKPCETSQAKPICRQISCMVRPKEPSLRIGKNNITIDEYPLRYYPPMCPGLVYIFPSTLIDRLLEASQQVPFIWLDDVYVTVFLRESIGEKLHSLRRYYLQPADKRYRLLYKKKMIAHLNSKHFVTDYIRLWNEMLKSYQ